MPATSAKQKKFMDAAAHNPAFAKKAGVPVKVAKEYSQASKGQTFKQGGEMKESKAMMKKEVDFMKKKGAPKAMIKHEMAEAKMKKFGNGGSPTVSGFPDKGAPPMPVKPAPKMPGKPTVTSAPSRPAPSRPMRGLKGGLGMSGVRPVSAPLSPQNMARGGGIEKKGKTKGEMVKMARGGGIEIRGKTKGKMLARGGKTC